MTFSYQWREFFLCWRVTFSFLFLFNIRNGSATTIYFHFFASNPTENWSEQRKSGNSIITRMLFIVLLAPLKKSSGFCLSFYYAKHCLFDAIMMVSGWKLSRYTVVGNGCLKAQNRQRSIWLLNFYSKLQQARLEMSKPQIRLL